MSRHSDYTSNYTSNNFSRDETYYDILSIKKNATQVEIRNAYDVLSNKCHPTKTNSMEKNRIFLDINNAYQVLSNPDIRREYDYAIENGALGGKLLGAGGGGFFLFYIKDFEKNHFMEAMRKKGLIETRFKFDLAGIRSWKKRDELMLISKGENSENW